LTTAMRPILPSGRSRPVPIALPASSKATACSDFPSMSSSSMPAGTFCSPTKMAKRIGAARGCAVSPGIRSTLTPLRRLYLVVGLAPPRRRVLLLFLRAPVVLGEDHVDRLLEHRPRRAGAARSPDRELRRVYAKEPCEAFPAAAQHFALLQDAGAHL